MKQYINGGDLTTIDLPYTEENGKILQHRGSRCNAAILRYESLVTLHMTGTCTVVVEYASARIAETVDLAPDWIIDAANGSIRACPG